MIEQIEIHQFKAFQHLKIETLRQVNLIVGANNVGKTALLEAVDLGAGCRADPSMHGVFRDPNAVRPEVASDRDWLNYLVPFNIDNRHCGIGVLRDGNWCGIVFDGFKPEWFGLRLLKEKPQKNEFDGREVRYFRPDPEAAVVRVSAWPLNPDAMNEMYDTAMLRSDMEFRIEAWARELDPRIISIRSQKPAGRIRQIYVDIGASKKIPLIQLGQGAQKLVMLASGASLAEGGVLLVDEIDVGFHHGYLERLWKAVFAMARDLNVQVFATTHSYECIKAAAKVAAEIEGDQLALHRLERKNETIQCRSVTEDLLQETLDAGFEVR